MPYRPSGASAGWRGWLPANWRRRRSGKMTKPLKVLRCGNRGIWPARPKLTHSGNIELPQIRIPATRAPGEQPLLQQIFVLADGGCLSLLAVFEVVQEVFNGLGDRRHLDRDGSNFPGGIPAPYQVAGCLPRAEVEAA